MPEVDGLRVLFIGNRDPRKRYRFLLEPLREIGVNADLFDGSGAMPATLFKVVRRLRQQPRADVLILTGADTRNFLWFLLASLLTQTRVVLRFGGNPLEVRNSVERDIDRRRNLKDILRSLVASFVTRTLLKRVDAVVVVSDYLLSDMQAAIGERVRTLVLPPTLKAPAAAADAVPEREDESSVRLLTVTNLKYREKAQGVLAIATAVDRIVTSRDADAIEIRYDVLGGGYQLEYLQQSLDARGFGARDSIHLHGKLDNVNDFYRQADVFVYCSTLDGYPLVLCEAPSFGLPVVANRWGAFPSMMTENVDALFFEDDDIDGLTRALAMLIEDKSMRQKMSQAATENFVARHSSIECGKRLLHFLQTLG